MNGSLGRLKPSAAKCTSNTFESANVTRFQNSDFHPTHNFAYNANHCRVTTILITSGRNKIGNGYKNEGEGKMRHYFKTLDTIFLFSNGNKYFQRYIDLKYRIASLLVNM
uniref:SFRICE_017039 n=1 Tax=Spodoptera frugiperda TaxID=7108 RepID=A0A2H1WGQ3_SPOFR